MRIQARSTEGASPYSDVLHAKTIPDVPSPCAVPVLRSSAQAHSLELSWAPVQGYGVDVEFSLLMRCCLQ